MGKNSKSQSDLSRVEGVANVFKTGDLERAVKAHCAYLFKSKVVEGAEQPALKSGDTWDKVLAVSETAIHRMESQEYVSGSEQKKYHLL